MGYSIYELLWMFLIYAFLGWCAEVAFHAVVEGDFANRGFLNGPVCPIYGVGATVVILCLTPIKNVLLLFVFSMIITSVLEFITGFLLEKIYHTNWWDYSDKPFNICGYVCLEFSIMWGFACIALMKGIHPLIMDFINIIHNTLGIIVLLFLLAVLIADIAVTVAALNQLNKRIKHMNELAGSIRRVSDKIGNGIYETVNEIEKKKEGIIQTEEFQDFKERIDDVRERVDAAKTRHEEELEALKKLYSDIISEGHVFQHRIIKAFPKMKSFKYEEQLE